MTGVWAYNIAISRMDMLDAFITTATASTVIVNVFVLAIGVAMVNIISEWIGRVAMPSIRFGRHGLNRMSCLFHI